LEYQKVWFLFAAMEKKLFRQKNQKIGSILYQLRNELGIKQIDLQNEGFISQSRLSKIENGEVVISAIQLIEFAERYGVPIMYFYDKLNENKT